jgi:LysR family nitrogen assimilation transcriptional regulator
MAIDLRGLKSFVAVASAGSISRAAENRHIAQPALSTHIRQIEEQLGTPLFDRHPRGVTLTSAGERFLIHAADILRRVDAAYDDVRDAVDEPAGRVAIGLPQSVAKFLTVPMVQEVVRRWPKIQLQMVELSSGYIPDNLVKGHIDIGLTFGTENDARIQFKHLMDEELVFVTSSGQLENVLLGDRPRMDTIALGELKPFSIILPTEAHSLRRRINEYLTQEKVKLNVVAEVNTIPQLVELASAGVGSTILSHASVRDDVSAGRIATLGISSPLMKRPVYLCRSSTAPLSIATSKVQDLLHDTIRTLVSSGTWLAELSDRSIA